jgi:YidC/Oxa1 family membrane protein insertase
MGSELTPERRMVVALLLSFAIYLGWSYYTLDQRKHAIPATPVAETGVPAAATGATAPSVIPSAVTPVAPPAAVAPEQIVEIESPELHLSLSSWGGALVHAQLKAPKYQREVDGKEEAVDLARVTKEGHRPLETKYGGVLSALPESAAYQVESDADGRGVRFTRHEGTATIEKHFFLVAPYLAELDVTVKGTAPDHLDLSYAGDQPPGTGTSSSLFGFGRSVPNLATGMCLVDGTSTRGQGGRPGEIKAEMKTVPKDGKTGQVSFAGLDERFFVGAVYVAGAERLGRCAVESQTSGSVAAALELPLAPDQVRRFGVYLGPKDFDRLRKSSLLPGESAPSAGLDSAIDFGFWTALCIPMLLAMELFHNDVVRNWGLAIILLTVLIKLLLLPLQDRSYRSMEKMRQLAPEVEALKKKHGEDKEALNRETMKMYSEKGANPLGSCLPMLIQMPIWFALYRLLGNTIQLYREPFIAGWINDLTAPDPFYALPLGMGATMVVTQLLTPQTLQGGQQKFLMWFMPVFFTLTFLKVPAGLSLYIFASNLLNIIQQYWLKRRFKSPPPSPSPN